MADEDAVEWARSLSLYKADGTPDVEAAGKLLAIAEKRADKKAQAAVQPILQQSANAKSQANFRAALSMKDRDGNTPNEQHLRALWQSMPVEYTQDEKVAGILALTAFGAAQAMGKPTIQPPAQPPVFTEGSGGHPRTRPVMSEFELRVAKERGITPDKWTEHTKGHQPGRPMVIEDV